jgi:hypothetical protein
MSEDQFIRKNRTGSEYRSSLEQFEGENRTENKTKM